MSDIPWDKLGIPDSLRAHCAPEAPRAIRMGAARGLVPTTPDVALAILYVCAATGDEELVSTAAATLRTFPDLLKALGPRTHSKILEFIAEVRPDPLIDEVLCRHQNLNDRSVILIAARANKSLAEQLCDNHMRLVVTPEVIITLYQNPATPQAPLDRAISFLRMEGALPPLPATRGGGQPEPAAAVGAPPPPEVDLDAEIEAALAGRPSPVLEARQRLELFDLDAIKSKGGSLAGFSFDFKSEDDFSLDLTSEGGDTPPEARLTIEKKIASMSPGKKIKLAYLGNKEARNILLRDRNKQVALAVIKSGRMTENEALNAAGNRNLASEVLRELSTIREWMRKYPVKVALVNNPRTPPSISVPLVNQLGKKELEQLARNKNVSSVIFTMAEKLSRQKAQGERKEG